MIGGVKSGPCRVKWSQRLSSIVFVNVTLGL
jgi:hypothetical protein